MVFIDLTLSTVLFFIMVVITAIIHDEGLFTLRSKNIPDKIVTIGVSIISSVFLILSFVWWIINIYSIIKLMLV